jgi:hypothetical protein
MLQEASDGVAGAQHPARPVATPLYQSRTWVFVSVAFMPFLPAG